MMCVDEIDESMIFKVPENTFHEICDLPLVSVDFIRRSTPHTRSWAGPMLKKDLVEQYLQAKPWRRVLQHHSDNVLLKRKPLGIHIVDTYVCKYLLYIYIYIYIQNALYLTWILDTYIYIHCMNHYVDKRTICVVDTEIFRNKTSQPCGWKTYDNRVHHLADPSTAGGDGHKTCFFMCFFFRL